MNTHKSNFKWASQASSLRLGHLACALLWMSLVVQQHASATIIAVDPFNYSPVGSPVAGNGANGSFGFSDNWHGDNSFMIAAGNLPSPIPVLMPVSNSVTVAAFGGNRDINREFSQPLGVDNTTAYFSFVMQPQGIVGDGAFQGWFGFDLRGGLRQITVGKDSFHGTFSLQDNLGDQPVQTNVPIVSGASHFFVLGVSFLPGNDVYKLYIDPPAGQPEPATPAASLNFDLQSVPTLGLTGPGAYGFDELRIGTTWNDVTSVPEPATGLLCIAAIASVAAFFAGVRPTSKHPDALNAGALWG